ncbi:hypothetical protein HMPREF9946_04539 [Acetobacteraceae bacterium AT-5844]|nr:hypothetical protein HMPREF9946_04539 [Acetobacteraceae bacterium AT-5844]
MRHGRFHASESCAGEVRNGRMCRAAREKVRRKRGRSCHERAVPFAVRNGAWRPCSSTGHRGGHWPCDPGRSCPCAVYRPAAQEAGT